MNILMFIVKMENVKDRCRELADGVFSEIVTETACQALVANLAKDPSWEPSDMEINDCLSYYEDCL